MNRAEQRAYNKMCLRIYDLVSELMLEHHRQQFADPDHWSPEARADRQALRDIKDAIMELGTPLKDVDE